MAFCTKCGASVDSNAQFCAKCGQTLASGFTPAAGSTAGAAAAPAAGPAPAGGSSALKVVLIVVAVLVFLGILSMASVMYFGYRAAKAVKQATSNITVETAATSPQEMARVAERMGVDLYPGATMKKGAGAVSFGGMMSISSAEFETSDSPSKVADFYKSKYPNATSTESEEHYSIMVGTGKGMTTIAISPGSDGNTEISMSNMAGVKEPQKPATE